MDVESQVLQAVDEVKGLLVFGAMVEVVSAEILVEGSRLEHMVSGSEIGKEEATAPIAFLGPRRLRRRWYWAWK